MKRGFTLLEVVIASAMGIVLIGVVTALMAGVLRDQKRARTISGMQRDMAFIGALFGKELRQAGLGVPMDTANTPPQGQHINDAFGGAGDSFFYAPVLVGNTSHIGIIADLPRDDANYPAFGALHSVAVAGNNAIAWHTENNGSCVPDSAGSCTINTTSIFFQGAGPVCAAFGDRGCPWGLRRVVNGEQILIADGAGRWADAVMGNAIVARPVALTVPAYTVNMAQLSTAWTSTTVTWPGLCSVIPPGPGTNCTLPGQLPSSQAGTPPMLITGYPGEIPGGGFVSTPDRVFFRLSGGTAANTATCATGAPDFCKIERIRCFGDLDAIANANFPQAAATAVPAAPAGAGACTPFEAVARNVESLTFTYFDATETAIAAPLTCATSTFTPPGGCQKRDVRRIDYRIVFRKDVDGTPVRFTGTGSVRLLNLN